MKTIWKGPEFQLVSVHLSTLFPEEKAGYHSAIEVSEVRTAIRNVGLNLVREKDILVFQGMTIGNGSLWPTDGFAMRFFMDPLTTDHKGAVRMGGPYKECMEWDGYELGLYRNLANEVTKDKFPHLFYAPVPTAYPRLTTLVARA